MLRGKKMSEPAVDRLLAALATDHTRADLPAADRAALDYAMKLTLQPNQMTADDVEGLRAAGFDDRGIHDVCAVTSYFNFVNRIADGLGVELESDPRFPVPGLLQVPP